MISRQHVTLMAAYNAWQNVSIYGAAAELSDDQRRLERGAFFGSIHKTLVHLLWGDRMWMNRFAGTAMPSVSTIPESPGMIDDWDELWAARQAFDATVSDWAGDVDEGWLAGDLTWHSGSTGREITKPAWLLVTHMFNHQTHHRGQVHCMLTQAGVRPNDTDIPMLGWTPQSKA